MDAPSQGWKQYFERHHVAGYSVFILLAIPVATIGYAGYARMDRDLTDLALSRRETITSLASTALEAKLDHLVSIATSLAADQNIRTAATNNNWIEVLSTVKDLEKVPALSDDFVDRIIVTDEMGIEQTAFPETTLESGRNLSFREWYQPIEKDHASFYVSSAYRRSVASEYNVIAVAAPIYDQTGALKAIVVIQVPISKFLDISGSIDVGPGGFTYFVDRKGQIIAHPKYDLRNGDIADYSDVPVVQAAFQNVKGIGIFYNQIEQEERLTAYQQIAKYHWAVIVQQPTAQAFQERDSLLTQIRMALSIILVIAVVLAITIGRGMRPGTFPKP